MNYTRKLIVMLLTVIYILSCTILPAAELVPGMTVNAAESVQILTVTGSVVNVRSGPGLEYSRLTTVTKDSTYTVLGSAKDSEGMVWYKIKANGSTGYIRSDNCSVKTITADTPTSAPTTAATSATQPTPAEPVRDIVKITGSVVSIRSTPSVSGKRIGVAVRGDTFSPLGQEVDTSGTAWFKIKANGQEGYVCSEFAVLTQTIASNVSSVTVTGAVVNVRSDAEPTAAKLDTVRHGDTFAVLGSKKDSAGSLWYLINTGDAEGYISSEFVSVKSGVTTTTTTTTTVIPTTTTTKSVGSGSSVREVTTGKVTTESSSTLNVRSEPKTGDNVIGTVNKDSTVTILGTSGSWYKISFNCSAGYGYVSAQYITNVKTETTLVTLAFGTDYYYVNVGSKVKLSASASGFTVTYSSENPDCAPIDSSGTVTGKVPGMYTITARSDDMTATAEVVVLKEPYQGIQHMTVSDECVAFIAGWEGGGNYDSGLDAIIFTPYKDSAGFWTVGYGHAKTTSASKSWSYARAVAEFNADIESMIGKEHIMTDDKPYLTEEEALMLLKADLNDGVYVSAVSNWMVRNGVKLNQQQFDALVSFCFNLGPSYWTSDTKMFYLKSAILCQRSGDDADPAQIIEGFTLYIKAGGQNLRGLWYRRRNEAEMFLEGDYAEDRANKFTLPDLVWGG